MNHTNQRTHELNKSRTYYISKFCPLFRAFSDATKLSEHLRTHTGERPFQCTQCGLTFSFQSSLSTHRKTHLREENVPEEEANMRLYYVCELCGKNFRSNGALKTHKLHVHDGFSEEVPCDVCGKSFRTRELLKQHQEREHSDDPKYVCDTCGQRFGNSYHLRRHETLHTDEEFPCAFCSRRFKRKDGLDAHVATIHDNHHHDHHQDNHHHDQTNNNDLEKIEDTNSLSEFMSLRPVEDEVDYFESTVSELRVIDPFKTPQHSFAMPDLIINHHQTSDHHSDHLHHHHDDSDLHHHSDTQQIERVLSQIDSLSQYKSTVTTSVLQYDQTTSGSSGSVFPVELSMYETPASVSVSVSAPPPYQTQEIRRLQVTAENIYPGQDMKQSSLSTFYSRDEGSGDYEASHQPLVSPPAPLMRQSVIRLNQKIRIRKM